MGWIVGPIKRYVTNQKSSKSVKNSWSYGGFSFHFRFLLIFRYSTDQRFRKELSDQDECKGWIVGSIKRYVANQKSSKSVKNPWRYSGFSLQFRWFCWFWGFQLANASGRRGLVMTLVWDGLSRLLSAWIPSKQIPIRTRTRGDIKVFH